MLSKSYNIFPLNNPKVLAASGQKFISNTMPSVYIDDVMVENNSDNTTKVSVDLCYTQKVNKALDPNWWFASGTKRTKKYRVRLIACYGKSNSAAIDFVSQRMNEYLADLMSTTGYKGAKSFVDVMNEYLVENTRIVDILSPLGPFSVDSITRTVKGSDDNTITYGAPTLSEPDLSDIVIVDKPALEALERDNKGLPNVSMEGGLGKASLYTMSFDIPAEMLRDDLGLYAFVYYDPTNEGDVSEKSTIKYSLQTSSGFIDYRSVIGKRQEFSVQTKGFPPLPPENMVPHIEDHLILNDTRSTTIIDSENVSSKLSDDVLDPIKKMLSVDPNQKPTIDVIKDINCFSRLWMTRSDSDVKRFIFSYDLKSFLLKESSFPTLYSKPLIARELINGGDLIQDFERAAVKYICVKKRQVEYDSYNSLSDIGTATRNKKIQPSATYPEEIVTVPSLINDIFLEDSQPNNNSIMFYEGVDACADNRKTQSQAKFQYGVKISVTDPSLLYLERVMEDLDNMSKDIENIYDMIKNSPPSNTNEDAPVGTIINNGRGLINSLGTKRVVSLGNIGIGNQTADEVVQEVIGKYISYAKKFELIPPSIMLSPIEGPVGEALYSLATSPKVESILQISSFIQKLNFSIERLLSAELPNGIKTEGNVKRSTLRQRGFMQTKFVLLEKTHFFSDAYEYGNLYKSGYEYTNLNYDTNVFGLARFTSRGVLNRSITEFNKYFGPYPNQGSPSISISPSDSYGDPSLRFFTPATISIYGQKTINQPSYVDPKTNSVKYDLDAYAALFLDIYKLKKETQTNSPFLEIQDKGLDTSLRDSLLMEDCVVTDGLVSEFETYSIGNVEKIPASKQKEKTYKTNFKLDLSPELFKVFLGGESDESRSSKNYFGLSETPLKPKNFGQVDFLDPDATKKPKNSKPPTKLMFNILGELTFNPTIDDGEDNYEEKMYNSIANLSKNLDLTPNNIRSIIEGDLSDIPNQYKSMLVIGASAERLELGEGFDAKRFVLQDQDVSTASRVVSNIFEGDSFPPYKSAKDPMKVYAKFLAFWMNYKQIGVLEYLAGFQNLSDDDEPNSERSGSEDKRLLPVWKKFDQEFYTTNLDRKFLCRIRNINRGDVGNDFSLPVDSLDLFDLPIYNKYFIINPEEG